MRSGWLPAVGFAAALWVGFAGAHAQVSDDVVRIGVLNDQAGQFSAMAGPGSVLAARMAAADFGGTVLGKPVEIVAGDHQNKADIGAQVARRWFDVDKVDAVVDVPGSAVALAVLQVAKERNRTVLFSGAASSELTGAACSPLSTQWSDDSYAMSSGIAQAVLEQGADTWFFLTADYAFGHTLEQDAAAVVARGGGRVLGTVRHPFGVSDFSSYLLLAQASGAQVLALANTAGDTVNSLKQAHEFGLAQQGHRLVAMVLFETDVHGLGLEASQGTLLATSFYWDQNDAARAFGRRFLAAHGTMPTKEHAGTYAAVSHYLKAVALAGTDEAAAANRTMRDTPVDYFGHPGRIEPSGRAVYDVTLYRVKAPAEARYPWDYFEPVRTLPAQATYRTPVQSGCKLGQ